MVLKFNEPRPILRARSFDLRESRTISAIIAYLRVSSDDQTVEAQRHSIENRFHVSKWFSDEATSGATKARNRPGFSALLQYVREGDTVVVYAIDRLGRDTIDVLETLELLKSRDVAVVSIREGFDLSVSVRPVPSSALVGVSSK